MRSSRADTELSKTPTLINLPSTMADSVTPSDNGPGTPNSAMTTMSELSTVAIKDGHRGHAAHGTHRDPNNPIPFDSERADRISRMAGLDRVAQHAAPPRSGVHSTQNGQGAGFGPGGSHAPGAGIAPYQPTIGYFLPNGEPRLMKAQSTVGSASATSVTKGSTATWTSASVDENEDNTTTTDKASVHSETSSMMGDTTTSSIWNGLSGGMSDGGSLVGFDEDAGSRPPQDQQSNPHSTLSGPSLHRPSFLPYAFPSHLRPRSPSSVSSYPPPSIGDSSCSRAGEGGHVDGSGIPVSSTPPPTMDQDPGPPNGRHLTTVERAEVALRQRAQKK